MQKKGPAFSNTVALSCRHSPATTPAVSPRRPGTKHTPSRLQLTRLSLHLLHRARQVSRLNTQPFMSEAENGMYSVSDGSETDSTGTPCRRKAMYTPEERRARSDRLRDLWRDPTWRANMLTRRRQQDTVQKMSTAAKKCWSDPAFRARMRQSRLGRPAPNKGTPASAETRLRMSVARKGRPVSEATRRKMSLAKTVRPENDDWPRLISESKRGKTKEYFQMRREFRALHRDLKLWSDSYRSRYGKLPSANTYEMYVAPMMILRVRRYLMLRDIIGEDEPDTRKDIISRN